MKVTLLALFVAVAPVLAADQAPVGPSHCYQDAESISALADGIAGHAPAPVTDPGRAAPIPRNPRHCWFKAREVFVHVQRLREANKLAATPEPSVPAGEIKPGDVHAVASAALAELKAVTPKVPAADAALVPDKKPGDVFYALSDAQLRLVAAGSPKMGPADCFQMAVSIEAALEELRAAKKVETPVGPVQPVTDKKPGDCYQQARGLLEDLSKAGLEIPGGTVVVENRTGDLTPGHVLDVLGLAAADITSLKAKAGDAAPFKVVAFAGGKTPSDVYAEIARARHLARSLAAK